MSEPIEALESFASELASTLDPGARKKLIGDIARYLRQSQAARIGAQLNPDGSAYEPRKTQLRRKKGRIKQQMFTKMRTARYLKAIATSDAAVVSFTAAASRIARVHQEGLRDYVNRRTGLMVNYPRRELLGFTAEERANIADMIIASLDNRQ